MNYKENEETPKNHPRNFRYNKTLNFLDKNLKNNSTVLDLGGANILAQKMKSLGHAVQNTRPDQNLDDDFDIVKEDFDCVTAFEIFEHLLAPYNLLKAIKAPNLIASIPLKLWFANAYWNKNDEWDCHYHEFEPKQFDLLLRRTGWKIECSEKWKVPLSKIGVRPLLRHYTNRYYIVSCVRG